MPILESFFRRDQCDSVRWLNLPKGLEWSGIVFPGPKSLK